MASKTVDDKDLTSQQASDEGKRESQDEIAAQIAAQQRLWVVKPSQVDELWNHEDPSAFCQDLLMEHLDLLSEDKGENVNQYSEFENRYEPK